MRLQTIIFFVAAAAGFFMLAVAYRIENGHWFNSLALARDMVLGLIPLGIAWVLRSRRWPIWGVCGWLFLWLLFYPNAAYLLTQMRNANSYWFLITFYTAYGIIGLFSATISLMWVHEDVRKRVGKRNGQLFIGVVSFLSGIGIHIGRFLDVNSWDIFLMPLAVIQGTVQSVLNYTLEAWLFVLTFGFLPWLVYGFLLHINTLIATERDAHAR